MRGRVSPELSKENVICTYARKSKVKNKHGKLRIIKSMDVFGFEPSNSRLPILRPEPLGHWGILIDGKIVLIEIIWIVTTDSDILPTVTFFPPICGSLIHLFSYFFLIFFSSNSLPLSFIIKESAKNNSKVTVL